MKFSDRNNGTGRCLLTMTSAFMLLFLVVTSVNAQTGSVNFSGSWAFNESKSSPSEGGFRMAAAAYVITQNGNDLTVETSRTGQDGTERKTTSKFTLDGKECSNVVFGTSARKSVVKWSADGKSLQFAHTMNFERDGQTTEFKTTETWKINDADKTLVIETAFNGPNGEMKSSNVYDKK